MGFNNAADAKRVEREGHRKYFLPRIDIKDYNILIDGRNFYDQNINDKIKVYDETRKVGLGKGDNYTVGSLIDYQYFQDHWKVVCCNLSSQSQLDSDPRTIQQIEFVYKL